MKPSGAHTHGPQGGGGLLLAVLAAVVLIGSGAASAAISALEVIAIVIACLAVAAVLGGIALLVYRARSGPGRSDRPGVPITARPVYQLPPEMRPQLEESHKRAIEPPRNEVHLHFHGMSPAEVAEAIRQADGK